MHIFFLWFYFDPLALNKYDYSWHVLKIIGFCFAYSNSCVNPIALYLVSTNFRKYFNQFLCLCLPSRFNNEFNSSDVATATPNTGQQTSQSQHRSQQVEHSNRLASLRTSRGSVDQLSLADFSTVTTQRSRRQILTSDTNCWYCIKLVVYRIALPAILFFLFFKVGFY